MAKKCERYRVLIHGHLDGELNADEERELKEHLGTCEECAKAVEEMSGLTEELNRMSLDFAEIHVWEDVKARVLPAPEAKRRAYLFPVLLIGTMILYKVLDIRAGFGLAVILKPVVVALVALLLVFHRQNPFRVAKTPNGGASASRR